MHTRGAIRVAVAALLLTAGCTPAGPAALSEADKTALRAIDQRFAEAVLAKNWAEAAGVYATEASLMQPNGPAVKGRAMIQAWLEANPLISTFTVEPQEIDGLGDLAYVRGTYSMTFTPQGAPAPIEDRGKYLLIQRKQADGSWLITNEVFNSDLPLPPSQ